MSPVIIGSVGVTLLLVAFILNLMRVFTECGAVYLLMNLIGSLMAAWYAWVNGSIPFLVLEMVWGMAALVRLLAGVKKNPRPMTGG